MDCKLCFQPIGEKNLDELLFYHDVLCIECRKKWEKCRQMRKIEGYRVISSYSYNQAFASVLFQYKECYDEALFDVFLKRERWKLSILFHGYTLCGMPSRLSKQQERGFSHLQKMFSELSLPYIEPFEKIGEVDQKQRSKLERLEIINELCLKSSIDLPRKIVLVDDVCTSGNTLKAALSILPKGHQIKLYTVAQVKSSVGEFAGYNV